MEEPMHNEVTQAGATARFDGGTTPSPAECAAPKQTRAGEERLCCAGFVPPSTIELEFVDGMRASLAIDLLGMPVDRINWTSAVASPTGETMTVNGIKGDAIPIDSSTLRYLVDTDYAAIMDAKLKSLQFSEEELERLVRDNPPPPEWFAQRPHDLTREPWK